MVGAAGIGGQTSRVWCVGGGGGGRRTSCDINSRDAQGEITNLEQNYRLHEHMFMYTIPW